MPTEEWFKENPKVAAYLSKELHHLLEDWMERRGIKKVSQGLITILEEYLGVVQSSSLQEKSTTYATIQQLEAFEVKLENLNKQIGELSQVVNSISNLSFISSPILDQSIPKTELSVVEGSNTIVDESSPNISSASSQTELLAFEQTTLDTKLSSPIVDESSLSKEEQVEHEENKSYQTLELSERKLSELSNKTRHDLRKHREKNEPGTPLQVQIEGKLYNVKYAEKAGGKSRSKWVAEPLSRNK
jgi:hypothetical protein